MYIREDGKLLKPDTTVSCGCCDEKFQVKDLIYWSGADRPRLLCPGCDDELVSLYWPDDGDITIWE